MAKDDNLHNAIRWFIIIVLIASAIFGGIWYQYGVALALIYLLLRAPLKYTK
ncbi:MAG: hypothetical protein KKG59_04060 [Nanoarchaeota archaeon]|nr:hypothetical protein [Nanoarchaeota archaeon]